MINEFFIQKFYLKKKKRFLGKIVK